MEYRQVLDYLYSSLPMFQKIGREAIKKDLTNTLALCEELGQPQHRFKSVHIAGTNGKGTSAHSLAAILQTAGYKTGLYTSPHLKNFTERIKINGREISREEVIDFVQRIKPALERIKPSFFEATVAMAFDYFAREKVDVAVVETGLGGRLDSTNIVTPEVSLITAIGFDHTDLLGNTLELIAGEKAGIIKAGIPVVIGSYNGSIDHVFEQKALATGSRPILAREHWQVADRGSTLFSRMATITYLPRGVSFDIKTDIGGLYYLQNLPGILGTVEVLRERQFQIADGDVVKALTEVKSLTGLKGRWQVLSREPLTICDVGHNEDGLREVFAQLKQMPHRELKVVLGVVSDKDRSRLWQVLPRDATYYFTQAAIPRALSAQTLYEEALAAGFNGQVVSNVNEGLARARKNADRDDIIFAGGSTFVVAEIDQL